MPQRFLFAVLSALLFTAYNVTAKIAWENFHPLLGVITINLISVIVAIIFAVYLKLDFWSILHSDKLRLIILWWVITAFAERSYFRMYSFDAWLSIWWVVVTILMITIFSLVWYFVFKENFSLLKLLWVVLAIVWVALISYF